MESSTKIKEIVESAVVVPEGSEENKE
jgi:tryptophanyl-tRNA synthetase